MQLKILTSHMVPSVQVTALLSFFVQKVSTRTGLDRSKSTGSDGISPKMQIHIPQDCSITVQVVQFLNIYWHIPTSWKLGRITPIPKGTHKHSCNIIIFFLALTEACLYCMKVIKEDFLLLFAS